MIPKREDGRMTTHTYRSTLAWEGSTAEGYDAYSRTHRVAAPPAAHELTLSSDTAFRGDGELMNPEQLLVVAASSCQLLSFLTLAARSRIDVVGYEDDADGVMPEDDHPTRITRITLRPRIRLAPGSNLDRARRLVAKAHEQCYIANSLKTEVVVEADFDA
jgi:organic hydroperoxide reductase OsmC/OhrA